MVKIIENPIKMDDLGGVFPLLSETSIWYRGPPNSVLFSQLPEKKKTPTPCRCTTELMAFFQACTEASELPTLLLPSNVEFLKKCRVVAESHTRRNTWIWIPNISHFFLPSYGRFFWVKHGKKGKNLTHLEDPCMIGIFTCY